MAGVSVEFDVQGLPQLKARINKLASSGGFNELLDVIGATIESQTHRRIQEEKQSPEGEAWSPWSSGYERTRHSGHSLLMNEGELDDSIQFFVVGDEVHVGTNLVYAAIHQFGGAEVGKPGLVERPFLGLSDDNIKELIEVVDNHTDRLLGF